MGEKSFLSRQQMRNLFEYHQRYNKLEYTFNQFVDDFCKRYEVRCCDNVTVHVPYSFPAKLSDLRLHRMQKNGEYMLYDFMSFELLGVPKLSAEEREEALKWTS